MNYLAPVADMLFNMEHVADLHSISQLPGYEDASLETAAAVLGECAKFNQDVVAPLNWIGDQEPSRVHEGVVSTTPGFKAAFRKFAEAGWQGVQHGTHFGGQGLPKLIASCCGEMLNAANLSFALCPLLTDGAIEALDTAGSEAQKAVYIPRMISGEWTGTMNLTEPQAGSDLSMVRTRAVPQGDGTYRLFGQKIYITYGEHDMADNIVHLVLARTPDAPEGVKGISLFIVPKFLVAEGGSIGARNDVYCTSIEHKLGIKASPTAVLLYGGGNYPVGTNGAPPQAGAIGELVGEENRGLEYMFVMMNAARFGVGVQGVAVADRAYQKAAAFARERVQSRDVGGSAGPVAIAHHPDVRRMLMTMRAQVEGARALAMMTSACFDVAARHPDPEERKRQQRLYEFLVPVVKGWSTEMSIEVASLGVQVHGGMGFIEETGAAQYYRDARILTIYEGTTAIQANDLIGRKTLRDAGATAQVIAESLRQTAEALLAAAAGGPDAYLPAGASSPGDSGAGASRQGAAMLARAKALRAAPDGIAAQLDRAAASIDHSVAWVLSQARADIHGVFAGSVNFLKLFGLACSGWLLARSALAAIQLLGEGRGDPEFLRAKIICAKFHADHLLPQTQALAHAITQGADAVMGLEVEAL
jgi:alkylation response protein AidB-like acyl-CoA dehydrogenase